VVDAATRKRALERRDGGLLSQNCGERHCSPRSTAGCRPRKEV
jgi:hypothetical protein